MFTTFYKHLNAVRSNNVLVMMLIALLLLFAGAVHAEDLASLDKKVTVVESQISGLTKQYEKEKAGVDQTLKRIEQAKQQGNQALVDSQTKSAYAATEQLGRLLSQMNTLKANQEQLCSSWRATYRSTVDGLLRTAEQEKDKKKKAEIGKTLQKYQARNAQLCLESQQAALFQQWHALRVENYDGPQEVTQKQQLLQDISREIRIGLTRLDQRYQEALREEKMRERAQEFVQEGTLFTEGVSVRPVGTDGTSSNSANEPAPSPGVPTTGLDHLNESTAPEGTTGIPQALSFNDWPSRGSPQQREKEYKNTREALLLEQKQIQEKIREFEQRAKSLTLP